MGGTKGRKTTVVAGSGGSGGKTDKSAKGATKAHAASAGDGKSAAGKTPKKSKKDRKKAEQRAREDSIARARRIAEDSRRTRADLLHEVVERADAVIGKWDQDPRLALRVGPDFDIAAFQRDATPGWAHGKKAAKELDALRTTFLAELQERLYAAAKGGASDSVLLVLQGLDTAGKGGIVKHVMGLVDPQGIQLSSFKAPTEEERAHDFLWRIERRLPQPGYIGVFDRSHYEDLLVPTAQRLTGMSDAQGVSWEVSEDVLNQRYHDIYEMEKRCVESGTRIVKVCLLVSYEEQGVRLRERLDRPDKYWKYSPNDLATREKWDQFNAAYQEVLTRTSTDIAPWYVIPADRKWYSRLAVGQILLRTLSEIDPQWPKPSFDPDEERAKLDLTMSPDILARYQAEKIGDHLRHITADEAVGIAVGMLNASSRADAVTARTMLSSDAVRRQVD